MRVIVVDDEQLGLARMEKLIEEIEGVQLIGTFIDPHRALHALKKEQPDIVFLDIEMPEINGIELAEKIQNFNSSVHIVFITAYSNYAIKAFEINALDYLLKPIMRDRLLKTISRLRDTRPVSAHTSHEQRVCCFKSLNFIGDGEQKLNVRWRTSKTKELFLFLLQHRQKLIRKEVIIDTFWPEMNWDKAFTHLYSTIYHIRKALESIGFNIKILNYEDGYILDLNGVRLDVDEWENGLKELPPINSGTIPMHKKLIYLYQGEYLAETDYTWSEAERERIRSLWFGHSKKLADYYTSVGEFNEAITVYHKIQELYPYAEVSYLMLMKLYNKLSNRYQVEYQYHKMTEMLKNQFNVSPSAEVQKWYERWKEKQAT